ncbi:contractile injection system protein, VgrG/Pvc8 family [Burkholderiaceae bacterium UC74_6]
MNAPDRFLTTQIKPLGDAPVVSLHCAIFLSAREVLGDETLRLVSFSGKESVSQPFEFELELHGNTGRSWQSPLAFTDVIGRPITVGIQAAALDARQQQLSREAASAEFRAALQGEPVFPRLALFNGIVASFAVEQPGIYRIGMRSALCKLGLTNAYRVHTRCSIRDAIAGLMERHRIDYSVAALVGSDNPAATRVQDWLQAGESDEDFLHRLMTRGHVYYYHLHTGRSHQVVFANRPAYPDALPAGHSLRYCDTEFEDEGLPQSDTLTRYSYRQSLVSSGVDARITREEAAWEADTVAGLHNFQARSGSAGNNASALPFRLYQIVQYGGSDAEVHHLQHATQDALQASAREFSGASLCPHLRAGHRFSVTQAPRADQRPTPVRPELEGLSFVLTQVEHKATLDGSYSNDFHATDAQRLVSAFSLADTQQGSLLGQVVSNSTAAAPPDWRYADRNSCAPENAALQDTTSRPAVLQARGVMVQLSTAADEDPPVWIKLAAHMQTVPEVGATVVIARAQDQTELPEIQSIIQSNVNEVIMPSGWTANTTIGSSYSTSYGDGKSIRFGKNSQGQLDTAVGIVEAQYASGAYREAGYSQGASYSYATSETGAAGLLSRSDSLGSTYSTHKGAVSSSSTTFENTDSTSVVTGQASSNSTHAIVTNTSMTGVQTDMSMVGVSTHLSMVGNNTSISLINSSTDISMSRSTTQIAMKGLSTAVEMTAGGINVQLTGAAISLKITLLDITL